MRVDERTGSTRDSRNSSDGRDDGNKRGRRENHDSCHGLDGCHGRRAWIGVAAALLAGAAGCGTSTPPRLHRLPLQPPEQAPAAPASGTAWELVMRVNLPAYLDRDEMLVDRGQGRVDALPGERWAEPLAEAVPRLLLHDLALLRGPARVWPAPAPTAAGARRRLRVQLQALQAEPAQGLLRLQARWTLDDAGEAVAPQVAQIDLQVPLTLPGAAGLVQAHRLALWRLAQRIVREASA